MERFPLWCGTDYKVRDFGKRSESPSRMDGALFIKEVAFRIYFLCDRSRIRITTGIFFSCLNGGDWYGVGGRQVGRGREDSR